MTLLEGWVYLGASKAEAERAGVRALVKGSGRDTRCQGNCGEELDLLEENHFGA